MRDVESCTATCVSGDLSQECNLRYQRTLQSVYSNTKISVLWLEEKNKSENHERAFFFPYTTTLGLVLKGPNAAGIFGDFCVS